jgi:hypothetical protein
MVAVAALSQPVLPDPFVHLLVFGPVMLTVYVLVAVPAHDLWARARPVLRRGAT